MSAIFPTPCPPPLPPVKQATQALRSRKPTTATKSLAVESFEHSAILNAVDAIDLDIPVVALRPSEQKQSGTGLASKIDRALSDMELEEHDLRDLELEAPTLQFSRKHVLAELAKRPSPSKEPADFELSTPLDSQDLVEFPEPPTETMSVEEITRALLAEVDSTVKAGESQDDGGQERVRYLLERAQTAQKNGLDTIAVVAADLALSEDSTAHATQSLLQDCEAELIELFRNYVGDTSQVPTLSLSMDELMSAQINSHAAFLASRIDGVLCFDELIDISGMPRLETHRYLCLLLLQNIVHMEP